MIQKFQERLDALKDLLLEREYQKAIDLGERTKEQFSHIYEGFDRGYHLNYMLGSAYAKEASNAENMLVKDQLNYVSTAIELFEECLTNDIAQKDRAATHVILGLSYKMKYNFLARRCDAMFGMLIDLNQSAISHLEAAKRLDVNFTEIADRNLEQIISHYKVV